MIGCCVYEYVTVGVTEFVINNYKLVPLAIWFVTILIIFEVVEQSTRIAPPQRTTTREPMTQVRSAV